MGCSHTWKVCGMTDSRFRVGTYSLLQILRIVKWYHTSLGCSKPQFDSEYADRNGSASTRPVTMLQQELAG